MAKWNTGKAPKEAGEYFVTVNGVFGRATMRADRVEYLPGDWKWLDIRGSYVNDDRVFAWMKCPEPYMGE